ncbi:MAG: hypothetical protein QF685_02315 [Verrucomicrobiota bacterium]|jgi:hypothetical protein|nr:hypothetical protein [Verrucomicrobiota bacterium]
MLLPTLAKAKTKANRMKCANNLGQIHRAFSSYSTEAEGATAHLDSQYAPIWGTQGHNLRARAMGYSSWTQMQRGYRWMNGYPIRQSLQNYSSLASPLDQKTVAMQRRHNIKSFDQWGRDWYSSEDYRGYIPHHMQSYAIAMQGDLDVQDTVLALTRNVVGSSHAAYYRQYGGYARDRDRWLFPHYPFPYTWHNYRTHLNGTVNNHTVAFFGPGSIKYSMTGMAKDQANWVTGGGAVLQGSSSEFNDQLKMADRTFNEGSAATRAPCLTILRPYQNR